MTGAERFTAMNGFFEHIAIIAGFLLAALVAEHDQRPSRISHTYPSSD